MNKTKKFSLIISLLSIMAMLFSVVLVNINTSKKTEAASSYDKTQAEVVSIDVSNMTLSGNQRVFERLLSFASTGDGNQMKNFSYALSETWWVSHNEFSDTTFYYERETNADPPDEDESKGTFTSTISLTTPLKNAAANGYLSVTPRVTWSAVNSTYTKMGVQFKVGDNVVYSSSDSSGTLSGNTYSVDNEYCYLVLEAGATGHKDYKMGFIPYNNERVKANFSNAYVTFSSSDITGPEQYGNNLFIESNPGVFEKQKTITLNIQDKDAGLQKVFIDGIEIANYTTNTKSSSLTFVVDENRDYIVQVYDNVGNESTFTYTSTHIDATPPTLQIRANAVDGEVIADLYNFTDKNVTIFADFEEVTQAENAYYYTLDGTDPTTASAVFNAENLLQFTAGGAYTLKILAIDTAGNQNITSYTLTVPGDFSVSYKLLDTEASEVFYTAQGSSILGATETYKVAHTIDGYQFYKAYLVEDETETELALNEDDEIQFVVNTNATIRLDYRKILAINITGTAENTIQYNVEPSVDVAVVYTNELGEVVENTADCGISYATYSIDTPIYYGTGSFKLVNGSVTSNNLTFSDDGLDFASYLNIAMPQDFTDYTITYKNKSTNEVITKQDYMSCLDAGDYEYTVTLTDAIRNGVTMLTNVFTGEFSVSKKEVSLDVVDVEITYNGEVYTFNKNFGYGYNVVFTQNEQTAEPKNAGSYLVTIVLNEANYITNTSFNLIIKQQDLVVTADNKTSVYGEVLETLTYSVDGFVKDETYDFAIKTEATSSSNQGQYAILFEEVTLQNYTILFEPATYTISTRDVQLVITDGFTKQYNTDDPIFEYEILNGTILDGDEITLTVVREAGEDVGTYAFSIEKSGNAKDNYNITWLAENFTITQSTIVIQVQSLTKTYGMEDPALVATCSTCDINSLGLVLQREAGESVGRYKINVVSSANPNFVITSISAYLTILPKAITITANAEQSKIYGSENPTLTYTVGEGKVGEDDLGVTLTRVRGEKVGSYAISLKTWTNRNYVVTLQNEVDFEILPRDITIKTLYASKVYGSNDCDLNYEIVTGEVLSSDNLGVTLVREAGENVGEYAISIASVRNSNYSVTLVQEGNFKFEITPKTLNVYIANLTKIYGENDPQFIYEVVGVVGSDSVEVNVSREQGEDVKEYIISATLKPNANYTLVSKNAKLTILKANSSIQAQDAEFVYDGEPKLIDAVLSCDGELTYKIERNEQQVESAIDAGEYNVEITFAGNSNYNASTKIVKLNILKTDAQIVIYRNTFVYNGSAFEPEINCNLNYKITFDDPTNANQVGTHTYVMQICYDDGTVNPNYNTFAGDVTIVEVPTTEIEGGSIEFEGGNIDNSDINLSLDEVNDKQEAQNKIQGVSVDKVYEVKYNQNSDASIKVELDYEAEDYSNVYVYAYNEDNEPKLVTYQIVDGKIVFSMEAENMKIAIVKQTAGISIILLGGIAFVAGLITWIVISRIRKKRKKVLFKIS